MDSVQILQETLTSWTVGSDVDAVNKRLEVIKEAKQTIEKYIKASELDTASSWLEKVADASRQPNWRRLIGESALLTSMVSRLSTYTSHKLTVQTLRLTGNSCADTDSNRALIVENNLIPTLIPLVLDPSFVCFVVPVLFNICNDYEPAQKAVAEAKFTEKVYEMLTGENSNVAEGTMALLARLIGLLTIHDTETSNAPLGLPVVLFKEALKGDIKNDLDDFISVVTAAWSYLAAPRFQTFLLHDTPGLLSYLDVIWHANTEWDLTDPKESSDLLTILKNTRRALISTLADITGLDDFLSAHPLNGLVFAKLQAWISPTNPVDVSSAACITLGNLARSDANTTAMVQQNTLHANLIALLASPRTTDSQLLHAALSFLRNLSLPIENKKIIGTAGLLAQDVLPRIWAIDVNPQVQYASIALTRILLSNTRGNLDALYDMGKLPAANRHSDQTNIDRIIDLATRSDTEPTKLEAARSIAAICRTLHTDTLSSDITDEQRAAFYTGHPRISDPLALLVTQEKYTVIRSEAWFVFALMSRTACGAEVVLSVLENEAAFSALEETVLGEKTKGKVEEVEDEKSVKVGDAAELMGSLEVKAPSGPQTPVRMDRENAVVLIGEVLKRGQRGDNLKKRLGELQGKGLLLLQKEA